MRPVYVAGVGQTAFGELDKNLRELGSEAIRQALEDSQVETGDIDAAFVGNLGSPADTQRSIVGQYCLREVGISGISVINVENACSSSACALREAVRAVKAGFEDTVLVLGVEKMTGLSTDEATGGLGNSSDVQRENRRGFTFPSLYAMKMKSYGASYGDEMLREALTEISIKNHSNALSNPFAQFHTEITAEDVIESPLIADPLRLYDFCPTSDGGAALILTSEMSHLEASEPQIEVTASIHRTGKYDDHLELHDVSGITRTAESAYDAASTSPEEIDVFEIHDASTIGELTRCEALGICGPGKAPEFILDGNTHLTGSHPVNPSGGLKARGHPVGATGVAQINEIVWQLRGSGGGRQVADARKGLALNTGGALSGVTANYSVHVLETR